MTDSYLIRATNHFSDGPRRCHQRVRRLEWPVHMPASTDMTCIVPAIAVRHHSKGVQRTGDIYCCRTQHGNNSEQMRVDETKWIQGSIGMIDVLRYNCSTMISLEFMNTQENPAKSNIFFFQGLSADHNNHEHMTAAHYQHGVSAPRMNVLIVFHDHEPWGRNCQRWATRMETEYPHMMCQTHAQICHRAL